MLVKFFFSQLCETVEASAWISVKLEIIIENGFVWNWSDQSDQRTHQSHQSCPSVEVVLPWWRQCLTSRLLADSSATVGFPPGRASPAKEDKFSTCMSSQVANPWTRYKMYFNSLYFLGELVNFSCSRWFVCFHIVINVLYMITELFYNTWNDRLNK